VTQSLKSNFTSSKIEKLTKITPLKNPYNYWLFQKFKSSRPFTKSKWPKIQKKIKKVFNIPLKPLFYRLLEIRINLNKFTYL